MGAWAVRSLAPAEVRRVISDTPNSLHRLQQLFASNMRRALTVAESSISSTCGVYLNHRRDRTNDACRAAITSSAHYRGVHSEYDHLR